MLVRNEKKKNLARKTTHHTNNQIPHCTHKLEHRKTSNTPENNFHVNHGAFGLRIIGTGSGCVVEGFQTGSAQNNGTKSKVAEYPGEHDGTAESLVVVGLLFFLGNNCDLLGGLHGELGKLRIILVVQIAVVLRNVDVDLTAGLEVRGGQFLGLVISLSTPCDIVGVAEGVDVEDIDVGWREQDVLNELEDVRRLYKIKFI